MANNTNSCRSDTIATRTDFQIIKFHYKWQTLISPSDSGCNYSPIFTTQGYESYQWKISLEFKTEQIMLYLHYVGTNPEVKAYFEFNISGMEGSILDAKYPDVVNFKPNQCGGFACLDILDTDLIIDCKVHVLIEDGNCCTLKSSQYEFIQKFGNLLSNDKFSDVKLVVRGHELFAHRAILALRSKVFAAMLQHEMEESKSGRIIITDFKPEVIKEMLHFMYTSKAPNLAEMTVDLLAAADKYGLNGLKDMCETLLCNQLSSETAIEALILADLYGVNELKSKAIACINTHATEIMKTQAWENAIEEQSNLIATELSGLVASMTLMQKK